MHYTGQVYRHPIEARTPLLEITAGCSHNKCSFCTMYRETPFKVSNLDIIEEDIMELRENYGKNLDRIFLVNGEPFILATDKLLAIAGLIKKHLPKIETLTCYASIKSLKNKSLEDLKKLREAGFNELHIGLESANDIALKVMNKGFNQAEAYENIEKLVNAGFSWDAIIMTGVAGKGNSNIHVEETAKLLNKFPPYLVSLMTTSVSKGTPLERMVDNKEFIECSEKEKLEEEKYLLSLLDFDAYFFGAHNYNLIPINGPLSKKDEIIEFIDEEMEKLDPSFLETSYRRANI